MDCNEIYKTIKTENALFKAFSEWHWSQRAAALDYKNTTKLIPMSSKTQKI